MTWFLAYLTVWLFMSVVTAEMHVLGKRPLPMMTCVTAGLLWPFVAVALAAVLVWWAMRTVGKWLRVR